MGVYILIVLSARISGSHYNPCVTLAFMFRKDVGRFSRTLGLAYFISQFSGALVGACLASFYVGCGGFLGLYEDNPKYLV